MTNDMNKECEMCSSEDWVGKIIEIHKLCIKHQSIFIGNGTIKISTPTEKGEESEGWKKEFDDKFVVKSHGNILWGKKENGVYTTHLDIKLFISNLLSLQRKEIVEKVRRMKVNPVLGEGFVGYNAACEDIAREIEK